MINQELYSDFLDLKNKLEEDGIPESTSGLIASSLAQSQMLYKLLNKVQYVSIDGCVGISEIGSSVSIESIGGSLSIDELQGGSGLPIYLSSHDHDILTRLTNALTELNFEIPAALRDFSTALNNRRG